MTQVAKFGEPWKVTRGRLLGAQPFVGDLDPEVGSKILEGWEERVARAPRLIWATHMVDPTFATSYETGEPVAMNDRRVLLTLPRLTGLPEDFPQTDRIAERIVHVINACAGIGDVEHFVLRARQLMVAALQ